MISQIDREIWKRGMLRERDQNMRLLLTVHTKGMFFQFSTTYTASKSRLVRPGPVTKLVMTAFQSMCATDSPATAAPPTPRGNKTPSAFADAILFFFFCLRSEFLLFRKWEKEKGNKKKDHDVLRAVGSEEKKRPLMRRRAKPSSSTTMTTIHNGMERKTQVRVVPHLASMEEDDDTG